MLPKMYPASCAAFIPTKASASLPSYQSSHQSIYRCSRRQALHTAALSLISFTIFPNIASAVDSSGFGDAIPSDDFERIRASVKDDVALADFVDSMQRGDVKRVWFFGAFNEYCCFEDADGIIRHIGEGYPVEKSRSPESPLQVMAKVRDNNVPYYVAPLAAKYLRR